MSRTFLDDSLLSWEAFASGGPFGYPDQASVVFNCVTEPGKRARFVQLDGDNADAESVVRNVDDNQLREMLRAAPELA